MRILLVLLLTFQLPSSFAQNKLKLKKNGRTKTFKVGDDVDLEFSFSYNSGEPLSERISGIVEEGLLIKSTSKTIEYDTINGTKLSKKIKKKGWRASDYFVDDQLIEKIAIRRTASWNYDTIPYTEIRSITLNPKRIFCKNSSDDSGSAGIMMLGGLGAYVSPFTGISKEGYNFKVFYTVLGISVATFVTPLLLLLSRQRKTHSLCEWKVVVK